VVTVNERGNEVIAWSLTSLKTKEENRTWKDSSSSSTAAGPAIADAG